MKLLTINYADYRGAGVSKTLPPDHEVIIKTLNEMRREATLKIDGKIIGKVEWVGKGVGLPHGRRWNWWYDSEIVDNLKNELEQTQRDGMAREPIKMQTTLGGKPIKEPWQVTQEMINQLIKQGGKLIDDYGFDWIIPCPREKHRYEWLFVLETEFRGETVRLNARKVGGWQQLLEKLRSARIRAGKVKS